MSKNEGDLDRIIRVVLGVALLALGLFGPFDVVLRGVVLAIAAIPLVTGAIGVCPVYTLFGIGTCKPAPRIGGAGAR